MNELLLAIIAALLGLIAYMLQRIADRFTDALAEHDERLESLERWQLVHKTRCSLAPYDDEAAR